MLRERPGLFQSVHAPESDGSEVAQSALPRGEGSLAHLCHFPRGAHRRWS
jgi:hypothetical protein